MLNLIIKYNTPATQAPPHTFSKSVKTRVIHSQPWLAYVGCRTTRERNASGRGLAVYRIDSAGSWRSIQLVDGLRNPSFLCLHPSRPRLYVVHGDFSEISTFDIASDGRLGKCAEASTQGTNPVHLALTPSLRWLLVANYASGSVAAMRVSDDGSLGAVASLLKLPGEPGPHAQHDSSHPHQICIAPDGRYALVPDKGLDTVFALEVHEDTGRLSIAASSPMPKGSGPRHMVFHPQQPLAYIVGELGRCVLSARFDSGSGALEVMRSASTVPGDISQGSAAGIAISQDESRLFVSNRGHDSVAIYPLDSAGQLGEASWVAAGRTPRFIATHPADGTLVVACEEDHSIAALDSAECSLQTLAQTGSPVCIAFRKENL